MRRTLPVLPLVLASALVLAGCAGAPETDPTGDASDPVADTSVCDAPSGAAVEAVTVSADFGTRPTVEFTAPLDVDETERAIVVEGDEVEPGALVRLDYTLYNGTTGDEIEALGWEDGELPAAFRGDFDQLAAGFAKTIGCLGNGSRAVGVIPADEGFGEAGVQFGLGAEDALVFVIDVVPDLDWTTDLPEIGGTAEAPTVTLPAIDPIPDLRIAVVEEGDGAVVGPANAVVVNYLGTAWETGEIFDESYSKGPATFSVQQVVAGFSQALVGQRVGSRVLVTMPPSLGYGNSPGHPLETSTLVFLVDILDTGAAG